MRWLMRALASVLVLVMLLALMIFLMPKDGLIDLAEREFEKATGRRIDIAGPVQPSVWPVIGVRTGPVTLANADWGKAPALMTAKALDIRLSLAALISGDLHITGVELVDPVLMLERRADGAVNWELKLAETPEDTPAPVAASQGFAARLDRAILHGGRISFADEGSGQTWDVTALDLETAIPDPMGSVTLAARGTLRGQAVDLGAEIAEFAAFLDGKTVSLALNLGAGRARLGFSGIAGFAPLAVEGDLEGDLSDLAALAALAGTTAPDLPEGLGARSLTVKTGLTRADNGGWLLRGAEITADDQVVKGDLDLVPGKDRPKLVAQLAIPSLTLPRGKGDPAPDAAAGAGWSSTPIDAGALHGFDADIALALGAADLAIGQLGPTKARLVIDQGRAVIRLEEAEAYGGNITGQFVINARKGLSVGGDLRFAGLQMQPLGRDLAGFDRLVGQGDLAVKFLGVGDSLAAIIASLSGEGKLALGKGEVIGLDIAGMLRSMDPGYVGEGAKTVFDKLSFGFAMADGVLRSDDLLLAAPLLQATGAGTIDLGAQALDLRLLPRLLPRDDGTGGAEVPVLIRGPWADPKIRLDLEWLAEQRLANERQRAEEQAKARLEELARNKLGVTPEAGETLEDAAKRRLEEAVQEETGRVLDRILNGN